MNMPSIFKWLISVALLLSMATPAFAMISKEACLRIYSAAGSNAGIVVAVRGGTLTVSGTVEHDFEVEAIRQAAEESGADKVVIRVRAQN